MHINKILFLNLISLPDYCNFSFQMKEIQHILKGVTQTSLVIIDELCRSVDINTIANDFAVYFIMF